MGREGGVVGVVAVLSSGEHSERVAELGSVDPPGERAGGIAVQRLERCPAVSHAGYAATRRAGLRRGRRTAVGRTAPGLCRLLRESEVPDLLRRAIAAGPR